MSIHPESALSPEILLAAYRHGLFPMASTRRGEIAWFSPEQRGILPLDEFVVSRSLARAPAKYGYRVKMDCAFESVINLCAVTRDETWISHEIESSYISLHKLGWAHSVETYQKGELVGGLYGVSISGAFFGESMFSLQTDASKVALWALVSHMRERGMELLDTQYLTPHLASLGGVEICREEYLEKLTHALCSSVSFR